MLTPSITAIVLEKKQPTKIMQHTRKGKIIMSTAYPIFDENGDIVRVISYAIDQTEISNLQEQYEQLERKLKGYQTEVEELREKKRLTIGARKCSKYPKLYSGWPIRMRLF